MLISGFEPIDFIVLSMLYNDEALSGENLYKINGVSFQKEALAFDPDTETAQVIDKWTRNKWLLDHGESGENRINRAHHC